MNTYSSSVVLGVTAAASPPPVTEAAKPSGVPETVGVAACARAAKPAATRGAECILVMVWSECEKRVSWGTREKNGCNNNEEVTRKPARRDE